MKNKEGKMDGKMTSAPRSNATTYLVWSILNTIFCCLPLGIAAIVFSCQTDTANTNGDITKAEEHSRTAKNLNIASLVIGIIFIIILITLKFVGGN